MHSAEATGLEKVRFHPIPKKGNDKECSLISCVFKVMLKIPHAWFQQHVTVHMYKLDLGKAEEPEIKLPNHLDHRKS